MDIRNFRYILPLAAAMAATTASAQEFFDTSVPDEPFGLGVRIGLNTSVNTTDLNMHDNLYNHNSWGLGFDAGVVANINIRDYISIQPGFFFQSRSGDYAYMSLANGAEAQWMGICGHIRRYAFDIPILASLHFNLAESVRWNVELGPYFSFNLKTKSDGTFIKSDETVMPDLRHKSFDFGFKMGTGLTLWQRYVVAVHYMAGTRDAWKDPYMGGKYKAWTFTVGYDF